MRRWAYGIQGPDTAFVPENKTGSEYSPGGSQAHPAQSSQQIPCCDNNKKFQETKFSFCKTFFFGINVQIFTKCLILFSCVQFENYRYQLHSQNNDE
ncbi:MAG: hypothetical protein DRP70_10975, partial [Spirochaetes bacterium]